jgi:hypothetical protein
LLSHLFQLFAVSFIPTFSISPNFGPWAQGLDPREESEEGQGKAEDLGALTQAMLIPSLGFVTIFTLL